MKPLDKLQAIVDAATEGPWSVSIDPGDKEAVVNDLFIVAERPEVDSWKQDGPFIATARNVMPALIEVARAAIEAGCICDLAQDRPGLTEHSAKCRALGDALAALDKAIEG